MDEKLEEVKTKKGVHLDTGYQLMILKIGKKSLKALTLKHLNQPFPENPWDQLMGGVGLSLLLGMVKEPLNTEKKKIPADWGTAVNVQTMVFGNMGEDSCTGVAVLP